ncbi:M48 family metallopeptidase [Gilliamella sp. CG16]|uniref:M48 family metallopeptidase n=1 Tax=Gilliamella sp. CG16 TaxID=3351503 RepID=UPI00398689A1
MTIIEIGSITIQLNRKAIKNLHISVLPPDGRVRASVPEYMTDVAMRMAVIRRIPWIKKQQNKFVKQPRQSEREMVNGECHYLWGRCYRLNVVAHIGKQEAKLNRGRLHLYVNPMVTAEQKMLVLTTYYRNVLKKRISDLLPLWENKIGVDVAAWGVKKMKTKWGSCNTQAKRIWLNLELAKKPLECLEYILVHELVHLLERNHNDRFKAHMDKLLPDWLERKALLNGLPLNYDNWL